MLRLSRRIVRVGFAFVVTLPAHAARPFAVAPYLNTCDGFLSAVETDAVEPFLMNQATTHAERGRLLIDYGLVFTPEYQRAVRTALTRRTFGHTGPRAAATTMRAIRLVPGESARFAADVLEALEQELAANPSSPEARERHARVKNFRAALARRADRRKWLSTYGSALRATIAASMRSHMKYAGTNDNFTLFSYMIFGALVGAGGADASYLSTVNHAGVGDLLMLTVLAGGLGGATGMLGSLFDLMTLDSRSKRPVPGPWVANRESFAAEPVQDTSKQWTTAPVALKELKPDDLSGVSPVDLAHAGRMELNQLADALGGAGPLDLRALEHAHKRVRERAHQLSEDWSSARARVRFAAAVNDLTALLSNIEKGETGRLVTGRKLIADVRAAFERIGRVPLRATSARMNDEEVVKQELLITRRQAALRVLDDLTRATQPGPELLEVVGPLVRRLEGALEPAPGTDDEWRAAVTRALDAADEARASFARGEG